MNEIGIRRKFNVTFDVQFGKRETRRIETELKQYECSRQGDIGRKGGILVFPQANGSEVKLVYDLRSYDDSTDLHITTIKMFFRDSNVEIEEVHDEC